MNTAKLKDSGVIDIYFSNKELVASGMTSIAKKQLHDFARDFKVSLESLSGLSVLDSNVTEKNYGYGADWTVALVQFMATSDLLKAIVTTGGIITFAKHIVDLFVKLKAKRDINVFLGLHTAKFYAIHYLDKCIKIDSLELVEEIELSRSPMGFMDKEYLFIFHVNRVEPSKLDEHNKEVNYNGVIVLVYLDWRGTLKEIKKY